MEFTTDWHTHAIASWNEHLGHLKGQPIKTLEIGSFEGRSAVWTIENLLINSQSTITCVDVWPVAEIEQRFDSNIVETGKSNQAAKVKLPSYRALRQLPLNQFDFIYIDGHHEGLNVLEDGVLSFRLLKPKGILIFDDYLWESEKASIMPKPAIDAFLDLYQHNLKILHEGWQVICQKIQ